MIVFVLADIRRSSSWTSFGLDPPLQDTFKDRSLMKKSCQSLVPYLIQKALKMGDDPVPAVYTLEKKSSGAPYLRSPNCRDKIPFVSLSHSGPFVGALLSSEGPVGLDLEDSTLSRRWTTVMKRFTSSEQALIHRRGKRGFYQIWTGREALAKCQEGGLEMALSLRLLRWPDEPKTWQRVEVFSPLVLEKTARYALLFGEEHEIFFSLAKKERDQKGDVHLKKVVL